MLLSLRRQCWWAPGPRVLHCGRCPDCLGQPFVRLVWSKGQVEPTYRGEVYAKTLVPGRDPIPALMATTDEADVLVPQLTARGWVPLGDPLPPEVEGQIVIGADRLRLVVNDQALLDDLNPYAPDGWWAAVDQRKGRCLVVILRSEDVDLAADNAGDQIAALVGSGCSVCASLPVMTFLEV